MKTIYAKCILRASARLKAIVSKIDDIVLKKALASFMDTSPANLQYEKILERTHQKDILNYVNEKLEKIISSFSLRDRIYIDYKYFKKMDKECYMNFDFSSRAYFRRQRWIENKIAFKLEKIGVDDAFFESEMMAIPAIKSIHNVVLTEEERLRRDNISSKIHKLKLKKSA